MYFNACLIILVVSLLFINECSSIDMDESVTTPFIFDKTMNEHQKERDQLKIDQEKLIKEKTQMQTSNDSSDVIRLNVGGEIMMTTRATLTRVLKSILAILFNGRWEDKLPKDTDENIFLDYNPILFRHLLEQLRLLEDMNSPIFYPPLSSSLAVPFQKILRKLGFTTAPHSSEEIIALNVGGELMTIRQNILTQVPQSKLAAIVLHTKTQKANVSGHLFLDHDPKLFRLLVDQLREHKQTSAYFFNAPFNERRDSFSSMLNSFDLKLITTATTKTTRPPMLTNCICATATWNRNGVTIAGGNNPGRALNELNQPRGVFLDDDNNIIYIVDHGNNRIVKWSLGASMGQVVAGGNGNGSNSDQLNSPSKIVVDENGTMFICDRNNRRVQRWFKNDYSGETIVKGMCWGLAIDNQGSLYITDDDKHQVMKWPSGEIVAGGNQNGSALNQIWDHYHIFVDENQSVFVADSGNSRITQWPKGAKEGIIVVDGNDAHQFNLTISVVVDRIGTIYAVDWYMDRVTRRLNGSTTDTVIIGGQGKGNRLDQLNHPNDIVFDRHGNLYVSDTYNDRIQMYLIDKSSCA